MAIFWRALRAIASTLREIDRGFGAFYSPDDRARSNRADDPEHKR